MNIYTKIPKKILAHQIQPFITRVIHHDQVWFIPGMRQSKFNKCKIYQTNKLKKKNHMIIFRKTIWQNSIANYNGNFEQTMNRREFFQTDKGYL